MQGECRQGHQYRHPPAVGLQQGERLDGEGNQKEDARSNQAEIGLEQKAEGGGGLRFVGLGLKVDSPQQKEDLAGQVFAEQGVSPNPQGRAQGQVDDEG